MLIALVLLSSPYAMAGDYYLNLCGLSKNAEGGWSAALDFWGSEPLRTAFGTVEPGALGFVNAVETSGYCSIFFATGEPGEFLFHTYRAKAKSGLQLPTIYCSFLGKELTLTLDVGILTPQHAIYFDCDPVETPFPGQPTRLVYFLGAKEDLESPLDPEGKPSSLVNKCKVFSNSDQVTTPPPSLTSARVLLELPLWKSTLRQTLKGTFTLLAN